MRNLRTVVFAFAISAAVLACGLGGAPIVSVDTVATTVAATIQALTPAIPASTATVEPAAPQGIPVKYKNVSFTIPTGLAADAAPQTVPVMTEQNGAPWDTAPEHINFRLDHYNVPAPAFSLVQIDVYPAADYANANAGANISLQRLQGVLGNPAGPLTNEVLPQVPYFNAASMFVAQAQRLHFQNGDGIRMITQYGQAVGPIANNSTIYHFQGLTSDGKYYIVAVLPIQAAFLQNGNDQAASLPSGGVPFPGYNYTDPKSYDDYFKAVTDKLNATPTDQFSPSLRALDAMMQSLAVGP